MQFSLFRRDAKSIFELMQLPNEGTPDAAPTPVRINRKFTFPSKVVADSAAQFNRSLWIAPPHRAQINSMSVGGGTIHKLL